MALPHYFFAYRICLQWVPVVFTALQGSEWAPLIFAAFQAGSWFYSISVGSAWVPEDFHSMS